MDELSKQQEGMERIGLLAASLYNSMTRDGVPTEAAERITVQVVNNIFEMHMRQTAQEQAQDPAQMLLRLLMRGGHSA